jgi:hypothetical protein
VDDELAAQFLMPPECTLPLQYVAMDNRSVTDKLAAQLEMLSKCPFSSSTPGGEQLLGGQQIGAQLTMPSESLHTLQYAVMCDHWVDNEFPGRRMRPQALGYLQISS